MRNEDWINLIVALWPFGYIKIFMLILIAFYIIFAAVCFRQIDSMSKMIEAQTFPLVKMAGLINLLLAIGLFFFALVVL